MICAAAGTTFGFGDDAGGPTQPMRDRGTRAAVSTDHMRLSVANASASISPRPRMPGSADGVFQ